jgi:hypothetical protein
VYVFLDTIGTNSFLDSRQIVCTQQPYKVLKFSVCVVLETSSGFWRVAL